MGINGSFKINEMTSWAIFIRFESVFQKIVVKDCKCVVQF